MELSQGFEVHRLVSVPHRPPGEEPADSPFRDQLYAAWVGAHTRLRQAAAGVDKSPPGTGPACVVAWVRPPGANRLDFYLAGRPFLPAAQGGAMLYPPGAQAVATPGPDGLGSATEFDCWVECRGQADALWSAERTERFAAPSQLADFAAHLHWPHAWLMIAEPCPPEEGERVLTELGNRIPRLRQRENSQADRLRLQQLEERYRELSRARATGAWTVRVLAGAQTPANAHQAAAVLCGFSARIGQPYVLVPAAQHSDLATALREPSPPAGAAAGSRDPAAGQDGPESPFLATAELLAALAAPPQLELPGVRMVEPSDFDATAETGSEGAQLGSVLDRALAPAGPFRVSHDSLNRHVFVCGATGSGKSQTVRTLLELLARAPEPVPWLVIEPAKSEYVRMAGRLAGAGRVLAIRPGDPDSVPGSLNPLEPEPGFPLQTHIDMVGALFQAAFEATEPFPQILGHALNRAYRDLGWDIALGEPVDRARTPRYPTLSDLRRTALSVVDEIGYGREVADNVRGFIDVRLGSLTLGTPGRFFEGGHPLDLADLLNRNTVLELEDIGNDQDKSFFIGVVVLRLVEFLRRRARDDPKPGLRHVTVIEEAHRLLKNVPAGSPAAHAVELFASLLAEIRAYGEGIVIAEQIPAKIISDVVKNTALKVVHRLPAHDDRFTVGSTMNLSDRQSRYIVTLPPGTAAVFADGMDRPVLVSIPHGEGREGDADIERVPGILRPRASSCSDQCHASACTLREMTYGARLARNPRLILWIELLTIAHIVGEPAPEPDPAWLKEIYAENGPRITACAVSHAIERSVSDRYSGLVVDYQPEDLMAHLSHQALARIGAASTGGSMGSADPAAFLPAGAQGCDGHETMWQAGQFRWIDVRRALHDNPSLNRPHPETALWKARGLILDGANGNEQLRQFRLHPRNQRTEPGLLFGTASGIPRYEAAAAALDENSEPMKRLTDAATAYLKLASDWPAMRLYRTEWRKRTANG
jgi:uncharacterized protein